MHEASQVCGLPIVNPATMGWNSHQKPRMRSCTRLHKTHIGDKPWVLQLGRNQKESTGQSIQVKDYQAICGENHWVHHQNSKGEEIPCRPNRAVLVSHLLQFVTSMQLWYEKGLSLSLSLTLSLQYSLCSTCCSYPPTLSLSS